VSNNNRHAAETRVSKRANFGAFLLNLISGNEAERFLTIYGTTR